MEGAADEVKDGHDEELVTFYDKENPIIAVYIEKHQDAYVNLIDHYHDSYPTFTC
jgi:hypothetical protein